MTIDIEQIKREVIDYLAETREFAFSFSDIHDAIDYLHSRGYLGGVPDGYVLVPKEPTQGFPSMAQAGASEMWEQCKDGLIGYEQSIAVYKSMIAAAPKGGE